MQPGGCRCCRAAPLALLPPAVVACAANNEAAWSPTTGWRFGGRRCWAGCMQHAWSSLVVVAGVCWWVGSGMMIIHQEERGSSLIIIGGAAGRQIMMPDASQ